VLREIAVRLTAAAREEDVVGRIGGDEFVVLVRTRAGEDVRAVASSVAQRICAAVAAPIGAPHPSALLTASIGIALASQGVDAVALLRSADAAMYAAKRAGRNGHACAS